MDEALVFSYGLSPIDIYFKYCADDIVYGWNHPVFQKENLVTGICWHTLVRGQYECLKLKRNAYFFAFVVFLYVFVFGSIF